MSNVAEYDDGRVRPLSGKMHDDGTGKHGSSLGSGMCTGRAENPFSLEIGPNTQMTSSSGT